MVRIYFNIQEYPKVISGHDAFRCTFDIFDLLCESRPTLRYSTPVEMLPSGINVGVTSFDKRNPPIIQDKCHIDMSMA